MDGWASLLKALTDKNRWLWGLALFGLTVFTLEWAGRTPDLPGDWYYAATGIGGLAALFILCGAVASVFETTKAVFHRTVEKIQKSQQATQNFDCILQPHALVLIFLRSRNAQRFPAEGWNPTLSTMVQHGLLEYADRQSIMCDWTYYKVPGSIWKAMHQPGWCEDAPVPAEPPWRERSRLFR